MKIKKLFIYVAALGLTCLFSFSCNKDIDVLNIRTHRNYTGVEGEFFNLYNGNLFSQVYKPQNIQSRSEDPQLIEIYNQLIAYNDSLNFVPDFVAEFGLPYWQGALVYEYDTIEGSLITIPVLFANDDHLSGLFICNFYQEELFIEFQSSHYLLTYIDSISTFPHWQNAKPYTALMIQAESYLFQETNEEYSDFLADTTHQFNQPVIMPRTEYILVRICALVPAGSNPLGGGYLPGWILAYNYHVNSIGFPPFSNFREKFSRKEITKWQLSEALALYEILGIDTTTGGSPGQTVNGAQLQIICNYYWVPIDSDPWDYFVTGNGFVFGNGNNGPPNPPSVNLAPHLLRLESCGGLGELYDYGPSNPTGQHPDRIFCEQLQSLYDCLPFLVADDELIAWYLWYDSNYTGDTWNSLLSFGCNHHMSPILKEEGIKLFKELFSPGNAYPPFNNDFENFLAAWKTVGDIVQSGILTKPEEREWLAISNSVAIDLKQLIYNYKPYTEDFNHIQQVTSIFLMTEMASPQISDADAFESIGAGPPGSGVFWAMAIRAEYMALKLEHCLHTHDPATGLVTFTNCEWSETKLKWIARWNVLAEGLHVLLDLAGIIPGVGDIIDLGQGIAYTIKGEGLNATLHFTASLPFGGLGANFTKLATRSIRGPSGRDLTLKYIRENAGSFISFGDPGQLRRGLGLLIGNPLIAHHLVPTALRNHDVVQKAAKSADVTLPDGTVLKPWHMNDPLNGIPLDPALHAGNHTTYIATVLEKLNNLKPFITSNEDALLKTHEVTKQIKAWIANNPGVHIDNLILP